MVASTLLTIALSFGLSLLQANAAIIPVHARDDDSILEVLEITCTPLSGADGTLFITNNEGVSAPLTLLNDTLQEDSAADAGQQVFAFQNCTSTFMAETPTDTTFYGHVTLATDPSTCLVSTAGEEEPQLVTTMPCRTADDSGQMLQFWKLTTGTAADLLDFVGKSTQDPSTISYVTDFSGTEGERVVQIDSVEDASSDSPYQLTLVHH